MKRCAKGVTVIRKTCITIDLTHFQVSVEYRSQSTWSVDSYLDRWIRCQTMITTDTTTTPTSVSRRWKTYHVFFCQWHWGWLVGRTLLAEVRSQTIVVLVPSVFRGRLNRSWLDSDSILNWSWIFKILKTQGTLLLPWFFRNPASDM